MTNHTSFNQFLLYIYIYIDMYSIKLKSLNQYIKLKTLLLFNSLLSEIFITFNTA